MSASGNNHTIDAETYFRAERDQMVREQLEVRAITDARVLEAFRKVPRHWFVPQEEWAKAYADHPLPIGLQQTISQPYMVALMTQCLELSGKERVLEIGTGSGYQTAFLAELAGTVYTIERFGELSARALRILHKLGYGNVYARVGDGTLGWLEEKPFDRILVTAGAPAVPNSLREQLADDGLLVIPVGPSDGQDLLVIRRQGKEFSESTVCSCRFVKLVGQEGWSGVSPAEKKE